GGMPPKARRPRYSAVEQTLRHSFRKHHWDTWPVPLVVAFLERYSRAQLDFPWRRHRHCDCSELRRIDEAVRRSQVHHVEDVEGPAADLERRALGETEGSSQGDVESAQARSVDGIAPNVAECISRRRRECFGIEPLVRRPRARPEDGLAGGIGANRI